MVSSHCSMTSLWRIVSGVAGCMLAFSALGCQSRSDATLPSPVPSVSTQVPSASLQLEPTAPSAATTTLLAATPGTIRLGMLDSVPSDVMAYAVEQLAVPIEIASEGELDLRAQSSENSLGRLIWEEILVPVTAFNSTRRTLSMDELRGAWTATSTDSTVSHIYVETEIAQAVSGILGAAGASVEQLPLANLTAALWQDEYAIGIVSFEDMSLRMEALRIAGDSPMDNRFDAPSWPLAIRYWLAPVSNAGLELLKSSDPAEVRRNRDPEKLTVVVSTGVTAMARGTAAAIENAGDYAFPARQVGPELAAADLTLISNEIPFVQDCEVNNTENNLLLCSKNEYFEALTESGVDAIGLTGNHQNDFGYASDLASLALYQGMGVPTYGGGANDEEAWRNLTLEHNGNRLTFLGANQYGPEAYWSAVGEEVNAWAGEDNPGSARFSLERMDAAIAEARKSTDLVLAEVQHTEFNAAGDYQTEPLDEQITDFEAMIDAGATIVTGVQAHAPQGVELRGNGIILYGLGNLYFDQTWSWQTRTGLIARHTIYDHRVIHTELLVTVIQDDMQLRWATDEEWDEVLASVFAASRW